ncbi:DUF2167 domain-containing protein [Luteolibacter marinus]|uniref:DUF2167 domain-containing protein n=1 Tax=Luteolibacter marinus TaxID=2776705 RepID=UPI001865EF27|nr:DUF2167 domain-containing protein [Luteolibacter marinus]
MFSKSFVSLFLAAGLAAAQDAPEATQMSEADMEAAYHAHVEKILAGIEYKEGSAELPGGIARLELPDGYRFVDASGAKKIVVDLWGNPPGSASDVLGMVVPAGEEVAEPDSWAIVLSFEEDGYVSDEDADEIDYNELLEQLKEGSRESNKQREAEGYGTMELTGWAVAPHYDKSTKVLYWAKRFDVGDDEDALNYDVRVLGRRGVLSLNGIAGMDRVGDIEAATPAIVSMVNFNEGHRYADFNPDTDKKADYSLAGLVLGGAVAAKLAAKAGILAKLGAFLLAGKKFVAIALIGLAALGKKLFSRRSEA